MTSCATCSVQIPIEDRGPAALPKTVVKRLAVSRHHPLMVATTSAGSVLLYDLRAPRSAVAQLKPHGSPMVRLLNSVTICPGSVTEFSRQHVCMVITCVVAAIEACGIFC